MSGDCIDGSLRLVGGANDTLGLVEVCINNGWGGVCVDHFGTNDAEVVCSQLGFSHDGIVIYLVVDLCTDCILVINVGISIAISFDTSLIFGLSSGPMYLDQLSCTGKELSLLDCRARPVGLAECDNAKAAGIHCTGISFNLKGLARKIYYKWLH